MKNTLKYKGFIGSVDFRADDMVFHGKLEGITNLVTFEAETVTDLKASFEEAVDDYLDICEEVGKEPMKSFKGSFNVRIGQDLHRKVARLAMQQRISLNQLVEQALKKEVEKSPEDQTAGKVSKKEVFKAMRG